MNAAANFEAVARDVKEAVEQVDLPAPFRQILVIPLAQPNKLLGGATYPFWPALVLASAAAAGGGERAAIRLAAAIEVFIAATDVFDEIEDGDDSPTARLFGAGQALNAGTGLLMLAQGILARLRDDGLSPIRIVELNRALADGTLAAAAGQHLDLASDGRDDQTLEDALDVVRHKAGKLAGTVCQLGAMLGTDNVDLLALYARFGCHLGVIGQLNNDLRDRLPGSPKTDRDRAKRTLPLLYERDEPPIGTSPDRSLNATRSSTEVDGAVHFVRVIIDIERETARRLLGILSSRGQSVERMGELLG